MGEGVIGIIMEDGQLPPIARLDDLKAELEQVPARHRDDAIQESWIAHLEGRDPIQAINTYCKNELRHERRTVPIQDDGEGHDHFAVDRGGGIATDFKPVKRIRRDRKRKPSEQKAA